VGRAVAILKMRNSDHEKGLWTFEINDGGFEVQSKLDNVTGLLGWSALVAPDAHRGRQSRQAGGG